MDGYEVARRLRERPYGADVVLVALTGWSGREVRTKAAQAGFDFHLRQAGGVAELERSRVSSAATRLLAVERSSGAVSRSRACAWT